MSVMLPSQYQVVNARIGSINTHINMISDLWAITTAAAILISEEMRHHKVFGVTQLIQLFDGSSVHKFKERDNKINLVFPGGFKLS